MNCSPWKPVVTALALALAVPALAQNSERVAAHTDWAVFVAGSPKECYIVSPPASSVARRGGETVEVSRGDIGLFVAFRPGEGVANEVSFSGGYPFQSGSTVSLKVGSNTFAMTPGSGDASQWAWTAPADDARVVAALRGGADAEITGISSRGTTTIDTFSLMGFTAAVSDAEARCK